MSGFSLAEYMDGATLVEESVDVFAKAGLWGRLVDLERRLAIAEQMDDTPPGERLMGEPDPVRDLTREMQSVLEELKESKTVWFVGALGPDVEEEIAQIFPLPAHPIAPYSVPAPVAPSNPSDAQLEAHVQALTAYAKDQAAYYEAASSSKEAEQYVFDAQKVQADRAVERIVRAFRRIEKDGEVVAKSVTREEVQRIARAFGDVVFLKLSQAVQEASRKYLELTPDFLARMRSDQTPE